MKTMTVNYLLVLLAWGLFLNHHFVSSCIILLGAIAYISKESRRFNYKRTMLTFISSFLALELVYEFSSIKDFYLNLGYFLTLLSLNIALDNELIHVLKKGSLNKLFKASLILCVLFNLITLFVPNDWYTIFTKTNLFLVVGLIFSPSILTIGFALAKKEFARKYVLV